jgi:DNA-binding NtrC family response regulator
MVLRILLVEDDRDVLLLLQHVLLDAGYAVDCADGVATARALLRKNVYDLVLTDGRLGDGSGIAVADEAIERRMQALVVTGYTLKMAAEGLDRHQYLMKPVRPQEILDAVERRIGTARP